MAGPTRPAPGCDSQRTWTLHSFSLNPEPAVTLLLPADVHPMLRPLCTGLWTRAAAMDASTASGLIIHRVEAAASGAVPRVHAAVVRLDIEHWSAIEDVDILDDKHRSLSLYEPQNAQPDRARSIRSTRREDPVGFVVEKRNDPQRRGASSMHPVHKMDVRKALDVVEAVNVGLEDLYPPAASDGADRLYRRARRILVLRPKQSDGPQVHWYDIQAAPVLTHLRGHAAHYRNPTGDVIVGAWSRDC